MATLLEIAKSKGVSESTARRKMKGFEPKGTKKVKRDNGSVVAAADYSAESIKAAFAKPAKKVAPKPVAKKDKA